MLSTITPLDRPPSLETPQVSVEPLTKPETLQVARVRFPGLPSPALKRLLKTMIAAMSTNGVERSLTAGFASRSSGGREPGVRDFFKLCARVHASALFDDLGDNQQGGAKFAADPDVAEDFDGDAEWFCSEAQALPVVVESLDVLAGHLTSKVRKILFVLGRGERCNVS